jgi:hypothetical protein
MRSYLNVDSRSRLSTQDAFERVSDLPEHPKFLQQGRGAGGAGSRGVGDAALT